VYSHLPFSCLYTISKREIFHHYRKKKGNDRVEYIYKKRRSNLLGYCCAIVVPQLVSRGVYIDDDMSLILQAQKHILLYQLRSKQF